jgi:hypothetical protein
MTTHSLYGQHVAYDHLTGSLVIDGNAVGPAAIVNKTITFTAAAYEVATAVPVFTVTGNIWARAYGIVTTLVESDTGQDGTISLGVEGDVDALLPAVTANDTNLAAGHVWGATTTTLTADVLARTSQWVLIPNGQDIEIAVATEDITAGVIDLRVQYYAERAGASVVAV